MNEQAEPTPGHLDGTWCECPDCRKRRAEAFDRKLALQKQKRQEAVERRRRRKQENAAEEPQDNEPRGGG